MRFTLVFAFAIACGILTFSPIAPAAEIAPPTAQPTTRPSSQENLPPLLAAIRDARDPSSAVAAYGKALSGGADSLAAERVYLVRMADFSLPEMADVAVDMRAACNTKTEPGTGGCAGPDPARSGQRPGMGRRRPHERAARKHGRGAGADRNCRQPRTQRSVRPAHRRQHLRLVRRPRRRRRYPRCDSRAGSRYEESSPRAAGVRDGLQRFARRIQKRAEHSARAACPDAYGAGGN